MTEKEKAFEEYLKDSCDHYSHDAELAFKAGYQSRDAKLEVYRQAVRDAKTCFLQVSGKGTAVAAAWLDKHADVIAEVGCGI